MGVRFAAPGDRSRSSRAFVNARELGEKRSGERGMSADVLRWRPKTTTPPNMSGPKLLWTVHKQQWRIECILENQEADGWNVRVLLNGRWFFCCRFGSWNEAIQAANDKHAELEAGGWSPAAVVENP
jgi:hypothetical protein